MTLKTLCFAGVIALVPALSFAMCKMESHEANACATGMVWDHETETCVEIVTG